LKAALASLEDALSYAETANRSKSLFLANMSHEMRTPLNAVLGFSELILETTKLDDKVYSNLMNIYRAGDSLLNLINDILDISKIEANKLELHPREYDLPSLINDTITQSILYLDEKPVKFILDIVDDLPNYLFGDELRIKQVLNNLLSNAFKFTKEGSVGLSVRHEYDGDSVWLTAAVSDTGIGIKKEDVDRLFSVYGRLEGESGNTGMGRRTEGTGLGLSISQRVTEMMDGSITIETEYGKGSVFTVRLRQGYIDDRTIGKEVVESLKAFDYSVVKFESSRMERINLSYASVLVVDDNPTNLVVAKELLSLYGMTVDCVNGGQSAIDVLRSEKVKYAAVFMDHMMPEMDGIEATQIIREEIGTEYAMNIPIIALTANAIMGNEEMFISKGFQAFLPKPIDLNRLDAVLKEWVRDEDAEALLPDKTTRTDKIPAKERSMADIPGLDVDRGIMRFGSDEDIYKKCLQSFVRDTKPLLDSIRQVDATDLGVYAITVHGLRGSSNGIFAEEVGSLAGALELAAEEGDYEFINSKNQGFIDLVTQLLDDIETALSRERVGQKPVMDKPDAAMLNELLAALKTLDIDGMDEAMAKINSYEYTADGGRAVWLANNLLMGEYELIKERLID
jgi:CheY-like chemotaxis protein/HPt (histidine-containing phosphotransfer) domain-containing protein/two-component sensor histidine kinase